MSATFWTFSKKKTDSFRALSIFLHGHFFSTVTFSFSSLVNSFSCEREAGFKCPDCDKKCKQCSGLGAQICPNLTKCSDLCAQIYTNFYVCSDLSAQIYPNFYKCSDLSAQIFLENPKCAQI